MKSRRFWIIALSVLFLCLATLPVVADRGGVPGHSHEQPPQAGPAACPEGAPCPEPAQGLGSLPGNRRGWWKRLAVPPAAVSPEESAQAQQGDGRALAGMGRSFLLSGNVLSVAGDTMTVENVSGNRLVKDLMDEGSVLSILLSEDTLYHICGAGGGWDEGSVVPLVGGERVRVLGVARRSGSVSDGSELVLEAERILVCDKADGPTG